MGTHCWGYGVSGQAAAGLSGRAGTWGPQWCSGGGSTPGEGLRLELQCQVTARAMLHLIAAKLGESTQPPLQWWGEVPRGQGDGHVPL